MQPYQERVISEKADLDKRIDNLADFIQDNDIFLDLDEAEQDRMNRQLDIMNDLADVLGERIAAFDED